MFGVLAKVTLPYVLHERPRYLADYADDRRQTTKPQTTTTAFLAHT